MFPEIRRSIALSTLVVTLWGAMATNAVALFIQIPAVAFIATRTATSLQTFAIPSGVMNAAEGKYYAPVPFPVDTGSVCRFFLVHRDNDADFAVFARLLKKKIDTTAGPFDPPVIMAELGSGPTAFTSTVKRRVDTTIVEPVLDVRNAFYYVEVEFQNDTLEFLGVQIEVKPTCP